MRLLKRGDVYHVAIATPTGTKTISTRTTDKDDARRVVKESGVKELEMAAKAGRLTNEAIGQILTGKRVTVAKAIDKFKESLLRRRSPKTVDNTVSVLTAWAKEQKIETVPPAAVTEEQVDKWINNPESESKVGTRRVNLSAIRTFFDFCIDHGWVVGNPAGRQRVSINMRILSHEQKETTEKQCFTPVEVKQIIKDCRERGDVFWEFATRASNELGLRLGDICQLEWACFRDDGTLVVWTDKRDRRVAVPISDGLAELSTQIPVSDAQYVFPEQRRIILDPDKRAGLSMQFKRMCERLGITGKSFHSLRHTCITRWAKEGKSLEQIGKDVGHNDTETTEGYIH